MLDDSSPSSDRQLESKPAASNLREQREIAEIRKLELEARQIEERLGKRWFQGRLIFQSLTGGVVAAGLLAAWAIEYAQPLLKKKQELAALDGSIQERINRRQRLENDETTAALKKENRLVREQLRALQVSNDELLKHQNTSANRAVELQKQLDARASELRKLASEVNEDPVLRDRLHNLTAATTTEKLDLQTQIDSISNEVKATEQRGTAIKQNLLASILRNTVWRSTCLGGCLDPTVAIIKLLDSGEFRYAYGGTWPAELRSCTNTCTWSVQGQNLTLSWNNGFATNNFSFSSVDASKAMGTLSSDPGKVASFERVQ